MPGYQSAPEKPQIDWSKTVAQIRAGDPAGEETLYQTLNTGARLFLKRRLGTQDVDDRVHDVFVIVVQAILKGDLREPERLMGFVRTVLYRQLSQGISQIVDERKTSANIGAAANLSNSEPDPEQLVVTEDRVKDMEQALRQLKQKDVELLTRYYLREQDSGRICNEMGLSQTQFLVRKSRAKARLAELLRRRDAR
jgi:RNA polymerase sigma-70 factor, ECF subfamily